MSYSDELKGYGPDKQVTGFALKWLLWAVGIIAVLSVVIGGLGFVFGWFGAATAIVSPENVKAQFQAAYDDINALNAVGANICIAKKQRDLYPVGTDGYNTGESNVVAQEQNYQRISNHYNAYVSDPFRAKLVRPRDLPAVAPTETEALAVAGCSV